MNYQTLRKKYKGFVYESFDYSVSNKTLKAEFVFKIDEEFTFKPAIEIGARRLDFINLDNEVLDNLVFNLGLAEMPSYWKATASKKINVEAGSLNAFQKKWWHKLFMKGMGEYYYKNNIDFTSENFLKITSTNNKSYAVGKVNSNNTLVPFSGGKDSYVTLDLISKNREVVIMSLNPTDYVSRVIDEYTPPAYIVTREIDRNLLKLNDDGYLNGHTPFSSYLAFLSVLCAYLGDNGNVAFSNERSSNEVNVEYLGEEINHQYSKSIEFENDFIEYNNKYLSNVKYFSFLRPLYDLQISKIFASFYKPGKFFLSCNKDMKSGTWCGKCPKCLSTYILLYPFLHPNRLIDIFGSDLYKDGSLGELLDSMINEERVKPFECVGTRKEILVGLYLSMLKGVANDQLLLKYAKGNIDQDETKKIADQILNDWNSENNLDKSMASVLRKTIK